MQYKGAVSPWYQTVALVVGLSELVLLLCVFLLPETLGQHRMVSTNLFAITYYKAGTTILVLLQQIIVLMYLWRYWSVDAVQTCLAALFVCCALMGWILVVSCNPDADRMDHSIGAGLFVGGTSAYFVEVLRLTYHFDPISSHRYDVTAALVFGCAGVFALVYIGLYFSSPDGSWLWENLAFIVMAAGYIVFFWFHPFDPRVKVSDAAVKQEFVQCVPLLKGQNGFTTDAA